MEKQNYIMSSIDEYFEILDKENRRRSSMVAKSLVKYLQKSKDNAESKFDTLKTATK